MIIPADLRGVIQQGSRRAQLPLPLPSPSALWDSLTRRCANIQLQNNEAELPRSAVQSSILFGAAAVQTCHLQGHGWQAGTAVLHAVETPGFGAVIKIQSVTQGDNLTPSISR